MKVDHYTERQPDGGLCFAQSLLVVNRSFEEAEQRIIEGIASTPTPDRYGDSIVPEGCVFATPLPLLVAHNARDIVGAVVLGAASVAGITFRATVAKLAEAGPLKSLVDDTWQSVKSGLLRHVSVGFRPLDVEDLPDGHKRYRKWEWLELSLVSIPANPDARIEHVRGHSAAELVECALQADRAARPVVRRAPARVVRLGRD
ncbi:HK97 family phage prohead protease [Paraburkholderia sp. JPY419]|uniref:HK97 family phage prohead protease n=1 Tax=Paraburkholderia sp. JPY419 TaxID=667660 RepID=UPI003D1982DE